MDPAASPNLDSLTALEQRFVKVASTPIYKALADNAEFQATHEVLREYIHASSAFGPISRIPAPPAR